MKIALVSPYDFSYPGGVTEHIVALANGVRQRGHSVQILTACSKNKNRRYPGIQPVTTRVARFPIGGTIARIGISPRSFFRIREILHRQKFDVIHLQEPLTPGIPWWTLLLAHRLPNTVTVGTFHAYRDKPNWLHRSGHAVLGKFFTQLDGLIAVSGAARDFATQMFPGDYQIIPNGIDLKRFGNRHRILSHAGVPNSPKSTILFVGRQDKRKGFSTLFEAFLKIKPDYPHLKLQVVGPFECHVKNFYQKLARKQGVTDIQFTGYISPEKVPDYYHNADIFCAPSIGFESFGIVLLEAMAAGIPVVASDIVGYRAVVKDGREGLLVPPGQVDTLSKALRHLLDHPEQRRKMRKFGIETARQYSWDQIIDKILNVYVNTIETRSGPSGTEAILLSEPDKKPQGRALRAYPCAAPRVLSVPDRVGAQRRTINDV